LLDLIEPGDQTGEAHDPFVTSGGQTMYPMASIGPARLRVYIIETGGHTYSATGEAPGRKHYLAGLRKNDSLRCAIKGQTLYLLDPRGREHRLHIAGKR
jgi:hypothetical protein